MKVRVKYTKTGPVRFISHLDVMRYFQKALRRAEFDVTYSKGFSPHQLLSFAAPMPLGMTSVGEYFDAEFNSVTDTEDMLRRFQAVSSPYLQMTDIVILPDHAKNAMSVVSASDYEITRTKEGEPHISTEELYQGLKGLMSQEEIPILKKTKKNEKITDIRPSIYALEWKEDRIYMMLAAGSQDNLKPELVMEALCKVVGIPYSRYDYEILRLETYMDDKDGNKIPLISAGSHIS